MQNGTAQNGSMPQDGMRDTTMPDPLEDPAPARVSRFLAGEQARWEIDRTVWQHPHEQTPYGTSLVEAFEAAHPDGLDGDDVGAVVRDAASRDPEVAPADVVTVVLGTLGVHPEPERLASDRLLECLARHQFPSQAC